MIVNDVKLQPDEESPEIYRKDIKKLANKAKIKVVTEYPYATVKIGDCDAGVGSSEVWVNVDLLQDVITVPVLVTATDGETIATYNIILTRLSNNTSAIVSYDGVKLAKDENGKYNVSILDTATSGLIKVVANDEDAKVDINNTSEYALKEKEYTLSINTETSEKTIEVPITVVSEDETIKNSIIVITKISTNNNTSKVEGGTTNAQVIVYKTSDTRAEDGQVGDKVSQGQVIGLEGGAKSNPNHGTSTGHHLHFELRSASGSGHSLNPNDYIVF